MRATFTFPSATTAYGWFSSLLGSWWASNTLTVTLWNSSRHESVSQPMYGFTAWTHFWTKYQTKQNVLVYIIGDTLIKLSYLTRKERNGKEMLYLTTHSTHFIYGYMASNIVKDHSDSEKGNPPHILLFPINSKGSFICTIPQICTYHGLCYTNYGALAGTRNSSMGPPHEGSIQRLIAPWVNANKEGNVLFNDALNTLFTVICHIHPNTYTQTIIEHTHTHTITAVIT